MTTTVSGAVVLRGWGDLITAKAFASKIDNAINEDLIVFMRRRLWIQKRNGKVGSVGANGAGKNYVLAPHGNIAWARRTLLHDFEPNTQMFSNSIE
jgi:hypothetical protein